MKSSLLKSDDASQKAIELKSISSLQKFKPLENIQINLRKENLSIQIINRSICKLPKKDHDTYNPIDQINKIPVTRKNNSLFLNQKKIQLKKENIHLKKTFMLLLVCILLLLVELPHSLFLFVAVFENYLYIAYYLPLKEFIDLLVMTTYLFNFIIYSFMGKLFRKQFVSFYTKYFKFNH